MILLWSNLGMGAGSSGELVLQTFRQALYLELSGNAGITAVVGPAIFPGAVPRTHDLDRDGPALTYAVFKFSMGFHHHPGHNLAGSDGTVLTRVRLSALSYSMADVDALTVALYAALEGLWNATWGLVQIMSCLHSQEIDLTTVTAIGRIVYQIESEYDVRYRIAIPVHS